MSLFGSLFGEAGTVGDPNSWINRAIRGGPTASGVPVNEYSALGLIPVYAAIRLIAGSVMQLPLEVHQRKPGGGSDIILDHAVPAVFNGVANSVMTGVVVKQVVQGHVSGWGNGYCQLIFDRGGELAEIWPLPAGQTYPEQVRPSSRDIRYRTVIEGMSAQLQPKSVLHVRGLGGDGYLGYSPIQLARQGIGLALAAEEFGAKWFGNGSKSGAVLEFPNKLSPEAHQRLKENFNDNDSGLQNAHKVRILEEGMKWTSISIPPNDAQFIETRNFSVEEICRLYGIWPGMMGVTSASQWGAEQQGRFLSQYTLGPFIAAWESELTAKALTQEERRKGLHVLLDRSAIEKGDTKTVTEFLRAAVGRPVLTVNEGRHILDYAPIDDGDTVSEPLNMSSQGGRPEE